MLFSNANEHRLTFKKTRFSTSELVDSHQFFTYGRGSDVFSLVSKIVDRIDPLHVLYDEGDVYANLRVGTVEQAGVIADYGGMPPPEHHKLFNGDKVFGCYSPPQEKLASTK